jgi:hypothetical protein
MKLFAYMRKDVWDITRTISSGAFDPKTKPKGLALRLLRVSNAIKHDKPGHILVRKAR